MYTAIFFDGANQKVMRLMGDDRLECEIKRLHIPIQKDPEVVPRELFGTPVTVEILGYGNNGKNESLACSMYCEDKNLQDILDDVKLPTITISVSEKENLGKTPYMKFNRFRVPYTCKGVFGGYDEMKRMCDFGD